MGKCLGMLLGLVNAGRLFHGILHVCRFILECAKEGDDTIWVGTCPHLSLFDSVLCTYFVHSGDTPLLVDDSFCLSSETRETLSLSLFLCGNSLFAWVKID